MPKLSHKTVTIYTDGACSGNPGPGGWAAVLQYGDQERVLTGAEAETTNNRMEMTAALRALEALKVPCHVMLHTDSAYLAKAFTDGWLANWQRNGWKNSKKKPVENQDLWKALLRAACIVAALWPERVAALVSQNGYNIQDIAAAGRPASPETEHRFWYQYYFHGERGRTGLERNRRALARLLWRLWSPDWAFDDATFDATAPSFDNPDFVEVVIHSYRHRFGLVAGDPAVAEIEAALARQPPIPVPAVTLEGLTDGVAAIEEAAPGLDRFTGPHEHRRIERGGHNLPQEQPRAFADAILALGPETLFPDRPRR